MGLYKTTPPLSGRMGALWCLSGISDAAVMEYGCMGHMAYGRTFLHRMGSSGGKLYSTHIGETDIAMGDTTRLTRAIAQVAKETRVNTIFLLPSTVPEVIGVDLHAIAQELSAQFPQIQLIPVSAGGFDMCGHAGIELVLLQLVKTFPKELPKTPKPTFNIIASCADMFNFLPDAAEISRLMQGAFSMELLSETAAATSISNLEKQAGAHINLVLRREGEAAAKYLQDKFGTPYLMGRPYGIKGTLAWLNQIQEKTHQKSNEVFIKQEKESKKSEILQMQLLLKRYLNAHKKESKLILAGHADVITGIAEYGKESFGFDQTICYCDCSKMATETTHYLTDSIKEQLVAEDTGVLMASGELLRMANRDSRLQISAPDNTWRHAYEPPLVGFRGAVNLAAIWANEIMRKD